MERESLKKQFQEQFNQVKADTTAFLQGYDQALGWALNTLAPEETKTVNSGPTVVANQEK